nr:hypothetical protein [Candidatus Eremiobacteraeota bacterium]
ADAVVIVTDHTALDWQLVVDNAGLVVDTRNAIARWRAATPHTTGNARIVPLAATDGRGVRLDVRLSHGNQRAA